MVVVGFRRESKFFWDWGERCVYKIKFWVCLWYEFVLGSFVFRKWGKKVEVL